MFYCTTLSCLQFVGRLYILVVACLALVNVTRDQTEILPRRTFFRKKKKARGNRKVALQPIPTTGDRLQRNAAKQAFLSLTHGAINGNS